MLQEKILVVDDEISLVQVCQHILQEAGFQVRGAVNGRQALRLIGEEMPDLILLDVMMPDMSGIEVCRRVRELPQRPQPHILIYTTDDREEVRQQSLAAGANAVFAKRNPFQDLPEMISPFVNGNEHGNGR